MYYEINVSLRGTHYFATAERSLTQHDEAVMVFKDFKRRFPQSEGFALSLTRYATTGKQLHIDGVAEANARQSEFYSENPREDFPSGEAERFEVMLSKLPKDR